MEIAWVAPLDIGGYHGFSQAGHCLDAAAARIRPLTGSGRLVAALLSFQGFMRYLAPSAASLQDDRGRTSGRRANDGTCFQSRFFITMYNYIDDGNFVYLNMNKFLLSL